ncbi:MAG: tRNA (N6-isopentenyl adenosine(37)-C2)-methylthiotransferase MiaB [Clostridia bacterium]|nr:tRNA (N6-isopentenyl adenosine(37)-C2)-methylthiotransferase MiaB [Clostridia bacterium]
MKIINYLKEILKKRFNRENFLAYIKIFGCQQNEADAEKICGFLKFLGFNFTDDILVADLILFETCAVRHTAEEKILAHIGNLKNIKKANNNIFIAICGCMVEQENIRNYIQEKFGFIDLICGAKIIENFPELFYEKLTGKKLNNFCNIHVSQVLQKNKFKAWVPIISGCNNFCSYCIVPYVRGPEKSKDYNQILDYCKKIIKNGSKIITLLGQNVNSYFYNNFNFSDLLKEIDNINGEFAIRFMTSHPKDFNKNLVDTLASLKHFSNHLHLPVQSGNNKILKFMNRKYTREEYIEKINYAREKIKNLVITSDIIVGFPGETNLEFEDTVSLIKKIQFASIFNFIYSPRVGTAAFNMQDNISHDEKVRRISKIIKIQEKISQEFLSGFVGTNLKVVIEENFANKSIARSKSNLIIELEEKFNVGDIISVKIISSKRNSLIGKKI